ncbi:hypothetical protein DYB37_005858 [Aphanomyces astaci]|uniref:Uncharacterized protein n=1 Tax=Aphanomyces astaci TaxID=112090 RepID=A0A3R7AE07_APHAT|nr:hypothetical protein DYB35_009862 [Aphanomyces astaci]RHZ22286.1 hypothetical protein DYB37_005858 [Aphanomyces astaci]
MDWLFHRVPSVTTDVQLNDDLIPPLRRATAVLVAAGRAGVDTQSIAPSALTGGYGADVCALLDGACDSVLQNQRPPKCVMGPAELEQSSMDKLDGESACDWADDAPNNSQSNDIHDDDMNQDMYVVTTSRHEPEGQLSRLQHLPLSPVTPINTTMWAAEIHRNVPRIRAKVATMVSAGASLWRYRFEQLQHQGAVVVSGVPATHCQLQTLVAVCSFILLGLG